MKHTTAKTITALAALLLVPFLVLGCDKPAEPLQWHMVNVNHTKLQGDAHVLISGTQVFMIDSGYTAPAVEKLIPYLQSLGITKVDKAFVSHAHQDHYEGFSAMIGSGITIDDIYFNTPSPDIKDCCYNAKDFNHHVKYWKENAVSIHTAAQGDSFSLGNSQLSVIHAQNTNLPDADIDVNDLSLIMRWKVGPFTTLFTGDLNATIGQWLVDNKLTQLPADILKVPHHGGRGIAPAAFFKAVNPSHMMVPAPQWLWCGERAKLARGFAKERSLTTWVNGIHGTVVTEYVGNTVTISSDATGIPDCEGEVLQAPQSQSIVKQP